MRVPVIAKIVCTDDQTVRNWFRCLMAEGVEGLKGRPMPGGPANQAVVPSRSRLRCCWFAMCCFRFSHSSSSAKAKFRSLSNYLRSHS